MTATLADYPKCEECQHLAKNDPVYQELKPAFDEDDCLLKNSDLDDCPKHKWFRDFEAALRAQLNAFSDDYNWGRNCLIKELLGESE